MATLGKETASLYRILTKTIMTELSRDSLVRHITLLMIKLHTAKQLYKDVLIW
jgi:catechol-2,3-dioxygenase